MRFYVTFPNGESLIVELTSKELKGNCLLQKVYAHLNLTEEEEAAKHFGLSYCDRSDGGKNWLQTDDKLKKVNGVKFAGGLQFQFEVHMLPEHPAQCNVFTSPQSRRLIRQHLKNMLARDLMRCADVEYACVLDALIVQAELGNYESVTKDYLHEVNVLGIHLPLSVVSSSSLSEHEYVQNVQRYHAMLTDMTPEQADVTFLNKARDMPNYGYLFHVISDSIRKQYLLAVSPYGIHFIYDTGMGKTISAEKQETFAWDKFVGCSQVTERQFKVKLLVTQSTVTVRKFKVKGNHAHAHRNVNRFIWDMEKCRQLHFYDVTTSPVVSGGGRKKKQSAEDKRLLFSN